MRKLLYVFLSILVIGIVGGSLMPVYATQERSKTKIFTSEKTQNQYAGGEDLLITENVPGDLVVGAGKLIVKGNVGGNVIAAGGAVQIDGNVAGDVLVSGGYVVVNGTIGGDLRVFAGNGYVNSPSVKGDLIVLSGRGGIAEGVTAGGLVFTGENENVAINTKANPRDIQGYSSLFMNFPKKEPVVDEKTKASVAGIVFVVSIVFWILTVLGNVFTAYVLFRLFPVFMTAAADTMEKSPAKAIIAGIAATLLGSLLGIALIISLFGWTLFGVMFILFILATILAKYTTSFVIGRWVLKQFKYTKNDIIMPLAGGVIILEVLMAVFNVIPGIGWALSSLLGLVILYWGVGAIVLNKWRAFKTTKN